MTVEKGEASNAAHNANLIWALVASAGGGVKYGPRDIFRDIALVTGGVKLQTVPLNHHCISIITCDNDNYMCRQAAVSHTKLPTTYDSMARTAPGGGWARGRRASSQR